MKRLFRLMICMSFLVPLLFGTLHDHASANTRNRIIEPKNGGEVQAGWNVDYVGQIGGANHDAAVQGNYAYIGVGPRFVILDISDYSAPFEVGKTQPFPEALSSIAISGNYAYVADGLSMHVIDVTDAYNPAEIGSYTPPSETSFLTVSGNLAYIATDYNGLRIVDISNPHTPVEVGFYDPGVRELYRAVAIAGGYAYLGGGSSLRVPRYFQPIYPTRSWFFEYTRWSRWNRDGGELPISGGFLCRITHRGCNKSISAKRGWFF